MATVTLKYTKLNSSLSVGDYVFYMTPSTSGSYTVEDSFGGRYLGRVQSIAPPTNPPLVIQNVDMPFKNKRTSPNTGSLSALFNINTYGNNKFLVSKTLNPDFLNQVEVGDFIFITLGVDTVGTPTVYTGQTVTNPNDATFANYYRVAASGDLGLPAGTSSSGTVSFSSNANESKTIRLNDTTGIEVGNTVTGTGIPNGTTVSTISTNTLITVNNHLAYSNISGKTIDLTFTGTDNFHTIVIEADSSATMPLALDYFYFTKDRSVDSSGVLGYYAEVKMQDTSTTKSELYSVSSEIFESSK